MEKKELADIELRSEKARTFIGQVPPCIVRNGTIVITIILIVIAIAFYKIPYPISIEINGKVVNKETIEAYVPYRYVDYFQTPKILGEKLTKSLHFLSKENPKSTNSQSFHFKNEHLLLIVYPTPINRLNTCSLVFCLKRERRLRSVTSLVFVIMEAVALLHPTKISKA